MMWRGEAFWSIEIAQGGGEGGESDSLLERGGGGGRAGGNETAFCQNRQHRRNASEQRGCCRGVSRQISMASEHLGFYFVRGANLEPDPLIPRMFELSERLHRGPVGGEHHAGPMRTRNTREDGEGAALCLRDHSLGTTTPHRILHAQASLAATGVWSPLLNSVTRRRLTRTHSGPMNSLYLLLAPQQWLRLLCLPPVATKYIMTKDTISLGSFFGSLFAAPPWLLQPTGG